VFQLPLDVCCNRKCFRSRSGVASLLRPPSAASSLPGTGKASIRKRDERWVRWDAGRGSCVRRAQVRELRTDGRCLRNGWALGGGGCVHHGLGVGAQPHGDVGMAGGRSPVRQVQPTT
jgi:hypothetical protein